MTLTPENISFQELVEINKKQESQISHLESQISQMQFQIDQMSRLLFGAKRERFIRNADEAQLTLPFDVKVEEAPEKEQGRPRNPYTWLYTGVTKPILTNRGYTGHEHMFDFNLINMNGRVYDPALGLFLSPDPYVQAPDFTQNFNSYGYCFNNPFSFTDPSGEIVQVLLYGALMGAGYGGLSYGMSLAGTGNSFNWNSFGTSVLRGAVSGALSAGFADIVGTAFPNAGGFGYELGRGLSHGVSQGLVSKMYGESFKSGFASGLASSFMGTYTATSGTMATRILEASAAGGFSAYIMGGDWKLGAMQGAMVQYFNHERHRPDPGATKSGGGQDNNVRPFIKSPYGPNCESSSSWKNLGMQYRYWAEYNWTKKQEAPMLIKGIVELNPIIGISNAIITISTGVDIYNVEVSDANRYIGSSVSIITAVPGVGTVFKLGEGDLILFNIIVDEATK